MRVGVIILAAGASTRMGAAKQLLPFRGRPLILNALDQALGSAADAVFLVLGANAEAIGDVMSATTASLAAVKGSVHPHLVQNPDWEQGMGTSVQAGMKAAQTADLDAVILMLGDQPLISPQFLNDLIAAHLLTGKPLVAARYGGTAGVPALFAEELFADLLATPPAAGCKRLIEANAAQAHFIDCPEGELDIDTPEDLAKANALAD